MRRFFVILCAFSHPVYAQINDNFADGELGKNPSWKGDTAAYIVNTIKQLQLNSAGADTAVLYTPYSPPLQAEWRFWVKLAFSPSDNNLARIYLLADRTDLKRPLNGYFLRFGESGSFDSIDLWRQEGSTETKLIDGLPGRCAGSTNILRIKVKRDSLFNWELLSDTTGGANYLLEGTVNDTTFRTGTCLGIYSKFTSGNATRFYFDDIYAGPPVTDSVIDRPAAGDLVINEVLPDPRAGGVDFVELFNNSAKTLPLAAMRISTMDTLTGALKEIKVIENGDFLFPGEYLVLSTDGAAVRSQYFSPPSARFADLSSMPGMNMDGDIVVLSDTSGEILDQLVYTSAMHFPLFNDTKGVSLERVDPSQPAQAPGNWHSAAESAGFATPGARNSQYLMANSEADVTLSTEIFSPDNDGHNDVLGIAYRFDQPGFSATVTVYDAQGIAVRILAQNLLAGTEGVIYWDGVSDERSKAPTGIYVILFEAFHPEGRVKRIKKACVLASRL